MATSSRSRHSRKFIRDLVAIGLTIALVAATAHGSETVAADTQTAPERVATSIDRPGKIISGTIRKPTFAQSLTTKTRMEPQQNLSNDFEIYDALVELYYDDDLDGYYYGVDVIFDADTVYAAADVFARLYISLEGGPWELFHTTHIFTLFGDSTDDTFTVETELFSGYPTAYYDVVIDVHDADTDEFLATLGPNDNSELRNLPLEDQQKDTPQIIVPVYSGVGHSGGHGSGGASLAMLSVLLLIALRRYRAIKPVTNKVLIKRPPNP